MYTKMKVSKIKAKKGKQVHTQACPDTHLLGKYRLQDDN